MRFFHLADLHIGKNISGFSMLDDQRHILAQILDYTDEHKPDAVILAGDIYDRQTPGIEAVKLFDEFLFFLSSRNIAVISISGNHDSPERLNFGARIMDSRGIHMYGAFNGSMQKVTLEDKFGNVNFYMLPFIKPSFVRSYFEDVQSYDEAVRLVTESRNIDYSQRNIMVCHQFFISGGNAPITSESEIGPVGGIDYVDIYPLLNFDYVAMGHIHGPQKLSKDHIRYSGSPLKYSFSESSHNKSIPLVEIGEKEEGAHITLLPLMPLRDMRKIKGPFNELIKADISGGGNSDDYIHVTLTDDETILDPMGKLRTVYPNIMSLSFDNARTKNNLAPDINANDLKFEPLELFEEFFSAQNGVAMNNFQQKTIEKLLNKEGDL